VMLPSALDSGSVGALATTAVDVAHELMAAANSAGCTATSAVAAFPVATPVVVECGSAAICTTGTNTSALGEASIGSLAGNVQRSQIRSGRGIALETTRKQLPLQDAAPALQPLPLPQLHDAEPMRVVLANTSVRISEELLAEGALQDDSISFLQLAADDGGEVSARGIGRGRPMGEQQGPWHGPLGRSTGMDTGMGPGMGPGMGRGRVLAPPPGLRGPHRQEKIPHGLSQPWMPAPIPEEDDESITTPQQMWAASPLQDDPWPHDLNLPESAVSLSGSAGNTPSYAIQTPSCWASYTHTPAHTPVGHWTRPPSPRENPDSGQAVAAALAAVQGAAVGSGQLSSAASPVLTGPDGKQWAFIPIAMARTCPHCGKLFVLPDDAGFSHGAAAA